MRGAHPKVLEDADRGRFLGRLDEAGQHDALNASSAKASNSSRA